MYSYLISGKSVLIIANSGGSRIFLVGPIFHNKNNPLGKSHRRRLRPWIGHMFFCQQTRLVSALASYSRLLFSAGTCLSLEGHVRRIRKDGVTKNCYTNDAGGLNKFTPEDIIVTKRTSCKYFSDRQLLKETISGLFKPRQSESMSRLVSFVSCSGLSSQRQSSLVGRRIALLH